MTGKWSGRLENKGTGVDRQDDSIIEFGQNPEKCSGDMRKFTVT